MNSPLAAVAILSAPQRLGARPLGDLSPSGPASTTFTLRCRAQFAMGIPIHGHEPANRRLLEDVPRRGSFGRHEARQPETVARPAPGDGPPHLMSLAAAQIRRVRCIRQAASGISTPSIVANERDPTKLRARRRRLPPWAMRALASPRAPARCVRHSPRSARESAFASAPCPLQISRRQPHVVSVWPSIMRQYQSWITGLAIHFLSAAMTWSAAAP